jgi:hypothetical protein
MIARRGVGRVPFLAVWLLGLLACLLGVAPTAQAGISKNIEDELRLLNDGQAKLHLTGSRYRFSVFSFEDPDGTGLGNALATLLSNDILMNGGVDSRGVLRYVGNLGSASGEKQLRYFDKIEPLIESQGVQVAVWGVIRRTPGGVRIDSYAQVSPSVMGKTFSFTLRLPEAMGRPPLVHRIGPDRLLIQRLELDADQAARLADVASRLDELRARPSRDAPVVARLPLDKVYYLLEKRGDWVHVGIDGGGNGWQRATGTCSGACAPLLAVSRFATDLMVYDERGTLPTGQAALADDARAFIDQLRVVDVMNHASPDRVEAEALRILNPWCPGEAAGLASPPGGAALCNLRVLARLKLPSLEAAARHLPLDRKVLVEAAQQLAQASQSDPRHVPTLKNLATLFNLLGDSKRAQLASSLADQAAAR